MESKSLIPIDPEKFGVSQKVYSSVADVFKAMDEGLTVLEERAAKILEMPENDESAALAKELWTEYKNVRIKVEDTHKVTKADYLNTGRLIDSIKNGYLERSAANELALKNRAKYKELQEKARVEKLVAERKLALQPFLEVEVYPDFIATMDDTAWSAYFNGVKFAHAEKLEKERIEEEARIKAEEEKEKEREKLAAENEKLKKEKAASDKKLEKERAAAKKREDAILADKAKVEEKLSKEKAKTKMKAAPKIELEQGLTDMDRLHFLSTEILELSQKYPFNKKFAWVSKDMAALAKKFKEFK